MTDDTNDRKTMKTQKGGLAAYLQNPCDGTLTKSAFIEFLAECKISEINPISVHLDGEWYKVDVQKHTVEEIEDPK